MRLDSKNKRVRKTMKEKKNWKLKKVRPLTTGLCNLCGNIHWKLMVLKYLFLLFARFEPYEAVFIMNSKIHLRKNSSNEYFKTISHYLRVYSGFIWAARLTDWSSSSLLLVKFRGSFKNEALENEDRSTKHPKLENEDP